MIRLKLLIPFLLLTVIISAAAFTNVYKTTDAKTERKAGEQFNNRTSAIDLPYYYFVYNGPANPMSFDDYIDPDNYTMIEDDPSTVCDYGSNELCAILCEGDWNGWEVKPVFSDDWWKTKPALYNYYLYGGLTGGYLWIRD